MHTTQNWGSEPQIMGREESGVRLYCISAVVRLATWMMRLQTLRLIALISEDTEQTSLVGQTGELKMWGLLLHEITLRGYEAIREKTMLPMHTGPRHKSTWRLM